MFSNRMVLGGLCMAGLVAGSGAAARADNITLSGVACSAYSGVEAQNVVHTDVGVVNSSSSSVWVNCPIPRSPLSSVPPNEFYVDGQNLPGASTFCVATLYNFQGVTLATVSFTESAPASAAGPTPWDHAMTFSVSPSAWDYVSVRCFLPANRGGVLLGVVAVQP